MKNLDGGCRCGAVRYRVSGEPVTVSICHCSDCRRSAGAPMVSWGMFPDATFELIKGEPKTVNLSGAAMRSFCADCGTGLLYRNAEILPGLVDIQTSTLDDPEALPPQVQVQTAERLQWISAIHGVREFERYPSN